MNKLNKYKELGTVKSGLFFTTSTLRELANQYKETTDQYSKTQSSLVKEIVNIACESLLSFSEAYVTNQVKFQQLILRSSNHGIMFWRIWMSLSGMQTTTHSNMAERLSSRFARSFAHVAVNAPETYVKPTVMERGTCIP